MQYETSVVPTEDHVVIEPLTAPGKSPGGILIPETAREKPQRGTVLAAGPGRMRDNGERTTMTVKPGDLVLFGRYAGADVEEDGPDGRPRELRIVREPEILGVFRPRR